MKRIILLSAWIICWGCTDYAPAPFQGGDADSDSDSDPNTLTP